MRLYLEEIGAKRSLERACVCFHTRQLRSSERDPVLTVVGPDPVAVLAVEDKGSKSHQDLQVLMAASVIHRLRHGHERNGTRGGQGPGRRKDG